MFTMFHGFHLVEDYHRWKKKQKRPESHSCKSVKTADSNCRAVLLACSLVGIWFAGHKSGRAPGARNLRVCRPDVAF